LRNPSPVRSAPPSGHLESHRSYQSLEHGWRVVDLVLGAAVRVRPVEATARRIAPRLPIARVRHGDEHGAAWREHSPHLGERLARLRRVFQHVLHGHDLETSVREGQGFQRRQRRLETQVTTMLDGERRQIRTHRLELKAARCFERVAERAAEVEQRTGRRVIERVQDLAAGLCHAMCVSRTVALAVVTFLTEKLACGRGSGDVALVDRATITAQPFELRELHVGGGTGAGTHWTGCNGLASHAASLAMIVMRASLAATLRGP